MKFGHVFKETLKNEGFPPEWISSAISYSQLKKCINKLTSELAEVGLTPETLGKLLKQVEAQTATTSKQPDSDHPLEYRLDNGHVYQPTNGIKMPFQPKLIFYVNQETGEIDSARLDEETKRKLQTLAVETGMTDKRVFEESDSDSNLVDSNDGSTETSQRNGHRPGYRTVEIPLMSDDEFFAKLFNELSGLEQLQEKEEKRMHVEIEELGKQVAKLTNPDRKANKKVLAVWRQIFQIYLESGIFFGTTERDHGGHDAQKAAQEFQRFLDLISKQGLTEKLKREEQAQAFQTFVHINRELLQSLRFGEINQLAMAKILKKFDKQTALGVKTNFPRQIEYPEFSEHLAKAVCAEVSNTILCHVPQIDDYSCPMCMDLEWRPVRLRCGHIFCIRCLIVMQTNEQKNCPLCRQLTVEEANSDNLDSELAHYLKKWFPDEVKAKQKYNEMMAGVDQYGEVYKDKCIVM